MKKRFCDDTEMRKPSNENDNETLGAHLRNLLTPYKLLIDLHEDGREISEKIFNAVKNNLDALLKFADSSEMSVVRHKSSEEEAETK